MWYIYALKEPSTGEVRYVGCSQYPERRLAWHLYAPTNPELVLWLTDLQEQGLKPSQEILESLGNSRAEAEYQEVFWINKHAGKRLLNIQDNCKNLRRYRPKRRGLKLSVPSALLERLEAEAYECGMQERLNTFIVMKLNGYIQQPLPDL